jgi:hypothetical protein
MDDHRKRAKGTSGDDNVVASRWRLDSREGVRGAVTEKADCCVFLAYGSMAKMEAAGAAVGQTVTGAADQAGVGRGSCVRTRASF